MKLVLLSIFAATIALAAAHPSMEDVKDYMEIKRILSKPRMLDRNKDWGMRLQEAVVGYSMIHTFNIPNLKFSWSNCGAASDVAKVRSLSVTPDPIHIPGKIKVSAGVDLHKDIGKGSPISVAMVIEKKVFGHWFKIPCEHNFGSCTYKDLCELDPYRLKSCPADFIKQKVPCKCPFKQGTYNVVNLPVSLKIPKSVPSWLEDGDYKVKALLQTGGHQVACLQMQLSITK